MMALTACAAGSMWRIVWRKNLTQLVTEFRFRNDLFTHFLPQSC